MASFLNREQLYRLIQRELPVDVYPDAGQPSAYWSTADSYATAFALSGLYADMRVSYDNQFPQLSTEQRLPDWETKVFGRFAVSTLTVQQRRDRLLDKLRTHRDFSSGGMAAEVVSVIGSSPPIQLVPWAGFGPGFDGTATWSIGVSQLGYNTYLGGYGQLVATGPDACDHDASYWGLTDQQLLNLRQNAYTYEVRIFGSISDELLVELDAHLLETEPAKNQHLIRLNVPMSEWIP